MALGASCMVCASLLLTGCGVEKTSVEKQPFDGSKLSRSVDWTWNVSADAFLDQKRLVTNFWDGAPTHIKHIQFFIDMDNNTATGFTGSGGWEINGADYLIEDGDIYKSLSNNTWKWKYIGEFANYTFAKNSRGDKFETYTISQPKFDFHKIFNSQKFNIMIETYDKNWDGNFNTVTGITADIVGGGGGGGGGNAYVLPSTLPPGGIAVSKAPQFVVLGFDDNTKSSGIEWALNLFKNKRNADGSPARVSFYMNTKGLDTEIEDTPQNLLRAMKLLKNSTHEIGNHTKDHHAGISHAEIPFFDKTKWGSAISNASDDLVGRVGVSKNNLVGFRAPYLLYNQAMLDVLNTQGFLYDCSIEEGYASNFDGTNFRWPYQLVQGSPGHNEGWYGNPENPDRVSLTSAGTLWELPNHVFMVPKDSECARYGIRSGLWSRIVANIPYASDHKITGFDYNLWSSAKLNKAEVLGILKYNLDLRLKGNRAPFMIGVHSQYYVGDWAAKHAPNATSTQMQEAISEFVAYALSKSVVRIRPAVDIINWCKTPSPLR